MRSNNSNMRSNISKGWEASMPEVRKHAARRTFSAFAGIALAIGLSGAPLALILTPDNAAAAEAPAQKPATAKTVAKPASDSPLGGFATDPTEPTEIHEIGQASCREQLCQ